jgi:hypothetical protein
MTNRIIAIYDGETNTYIQREATAEEQAEIQARETKTAADFAAAEQKELDAKTAKAAILAKIGLTEEEAIILLTPEPAKPIVKENG